MSESTISRVESKLDRMTDDITSIKISVVKTEEHLKTLNGTVVRQEKDNCRIENRVGMVERKMWLAYGGILAIGILGTLKAIGIW